MSVDLATAIKVVTLCFEPNQPQRIILGLREAFIKRYIVERTNKAEQDQKKK